MELLEGCQLYGRVDKRLGLASARNEGSCNRCPSSAQADICFHYGVPEGAPAICQAKASGEAAVRSIAGSTVG